MRAVARGEQFLIDVEERDHADIGHAAMQHSLSADDHAFAAVFVTDGLGEDRLELLPYAAHTDVQVAQLRRPARTAQHRPFGAAAVATQLARRLHHGGIAALACRDLTTHGACQEA